MTWHNCTQGLVHLAIHVLTLLIVPGVTLQSVILSTTWYLLYPLYLLYSAPLSSLSNTAFDAVPQFHLITEMIGLFGFTYTSPCTAKLWHAPDSSMPPLMRVDRNYNPLQQCGHSANSGRWVRSQSWIFQQSIKMPPRLTEVGTKYRLHSPTRFRKPWESYRLDTSPLSTPCMSDNGRYYDVLRHSSSESSVSNISNSCCW